jgi:hypothetical protein
MPVNYLTPIQTRQMFDNQELGDLWGAIGQIGGMAASTAISSLFSGGGGSTQARGLQAIQAFGQQVIQALAQIQQAIPAATADQKAQLLSQAGQVAATLGNETYVYQAQRGDDAAALQQFKQQAAALLQQIQAAAGSAVTVTANGTVVPAGTGANAIGISSTTLLLIGGGLLLFFLMKE